MARKCSQPKAEPPAPAPASDIPPGWKVIPLYTMDALDAYYHAQIEPLYNAEMDRRRREKQKEAL